MSLKKSIYEVDKSQYINLVTITVSTFALIFAFIYHYFFFATSAAIIFVICSLACLASLKLLPKSKKNELFHVNFLLANFTVGVIGAMYFTGGLSAPVAPWLCLIPFCSSIVAYKKNTIFWAVICFTGLISFAVMKFMGISIPNEVPLNRFEYLFVIAHSGLVATALSLGFFVEYKRSLIAKEKEELQQNSFNQSKLASLGELSAGIAHEINNPLAIIGGKAYIVKKRLNNDKFNDEALAKNIKDIEIIESTVTRLSDIVKSMKNLASVKPSNENEWFPVSHSVIDVVNISREKLKNNGISFTLNNKISDNVIVNADYSQLAQVLINILNNAVDAVHMHPDESRRWITIESEFVNNEVLIKIIDGGIGIPEEISEKIFEPFFTTKDVGKGTGIGLSISRKILNNYYGDIELDSSSEGTCFVIKLPAIVSELKSVS